MIQFRIGSPSPARAAISLYIWVAMGILLLGYSLVKEKILPARFFYDASTIDSMIGYSSSFVPGASYASTAWFYRSIGADINSSWLVVAATAAIGWLIFRSLRLLQRGSIGLFDGAIIFFLAFLAFTYVAYLSKELVAIIPTMVFFALLPASQRLAIVGWAIAVLIYGFIFRTYWVLFLLQFAALYSVFRMFRSAKGLLLALVVSLFCICAILHFGLGVDLVSLRNDVNERRLDQGVEDARTMIQPWISGGGFGADYVNFLITMFFLLVPVPLALMFTAYHSLIFLLLASITWRIARQLQGYQSISSRNDVLFEFSILVLISFVSVQCMFEPDYGSFLRHLSPLYPFIVISAFRGGYAELVRAHRLPVSARGQSGGAR